THFTEMKVDPSFTFDNFIPLNVNIRVNSPTSNNTNIIQIYQDEQGNRKLIISGATVGSQAYYKSIRVPKAIKSLFVSYVSSDGKYESAIVPINGSDVTYVFGGLKSEEGTNNDCGTGTAITTNQNEITIISGKTFYVPYGSTVTIKHLTVNSGGTFNNCGTLTVNNLDVSKTNGVINNNGTFTLSDDVDFKGTFNNNGTLNVTGGNEYKTNADGVVTNNCSMYVTGDVTITGSGSFINNGYLKVIKSSNKSGGNDDDGSIKVTGNGVLTLGPQSLADCKYFDLEGDCNGPNTASYAGIKTVDGKTTGDAHITGYVDFCASGNIQPDNGHYGPNVTDCSNLPSPPSCSNPVAPVITSALTATGTAGQTITPYVILATGTNPITYTTGTLPAGLSFNSGTHTISGSVATAGTNNITLTADNSVGTDTKILVLTIGAAGSPPSITSPLTKSTTAGLTFSYTITATGENTTGCLLTFTTSTLPDGLTLQGGNVIGGIPTTDGTFDITLTAHNCYAPDDVKHLILTVAPAGVAPVITSSLTANGTAGTVFSDYTLTSTGTSLVTLNAENLPAGLTYDALTHKITGTPSQPGITHVNLTAHNDFGDDVKDLVITIAQGAGTPPEIQPPLTASGVVGLTFTPYQVYATGTALIEYSIEGTLPDGLSFDPATNLIMGTPTVAGTTNVQLKAHSDYGDDNKTLVITITSGGGGSIISYYPNAVDYGTFVFEDLWPSYGDYDCNDLVVNFQYKITSNDQNQITNIQATFIYKAAGADLNNGFGFVLNTSPANITSVSGCTKYGTAVTYDAKGFEAGHENSTVIIPVDAINTMFGGGLINTVPGNPYIHPITQVIDIVFATPQANVGDFPWNPFIFQNQVRGHEIHMKNQPPTEKADLSLFRTGNDASNPEQNHYYTSSTGLTWAFEVPVNFDYPAEKNDIVTCYHHFAEWAQSSGTSYDNWYMNNSGYRDASKIYVIP
ncbi:MAG: LruC domain-containing protein, partial [Bacteroidota bacterium]